MNSASIAAQPVPRAEVPPAPSLCAGTSLQPNEFTSIRRSLMLEHCKWDSQVGDVLTLASFPLILSADAWRELSAIAVSLYEEAVRAGEWLLQHPILHVHLGVPRKLRHVLKQIATGRAIPTPAAARVMRFDFHPTAEGWRISEVNSDVPGGYAEAGAFTRQLAQHYPGCAPTGDPAAALVRTITRTIHKQAARKPSIALLFATGFIEDLQVVSYLSARFKEAGFDTLLTQPGALTWRDGKASVGTMPIDAIVRFYQAEWLATLGWRQRRNWPQLLVGGRTPVVNPAAGLLTESKRFPLIWPHLPFDVPTWKTHLPETRELRDAPWQTDDAWLIKSAYCNTGDTVAIRALMPPANWKRTARQARRSASHWIAQRRFAITPIASPAGPIYPCIGVYVIDGVVAGAYGRTSPRPVIDFEAIDTAILVQSSEQKQEKPE